MQSRGGGLDAQMTNLINCFPPVFPQISSEVGLLSLELSSQRLCRKKSLEIKSGTEEYEHLRQKRNKGESKF